MTKSTITRERLSDILEFGSGRLIKPISDEEIELMARMALAAMEIEPVAYISKADFDAGYPHILARRDFSKACTMPVYAAQPSPAVPEEIRKIPEGRGFRYVKGGIHYSSNYANGWNACRAAMLAAAPQPQNAQQNIPEIIPGWIPVSERMPDCWCRTCRPVVLNDMRFVVCPDCGNKRCPRANDHRNACTGSNEPGQEGSAYPSAPQEVKP